MGRAFTLIYGLFYRQQPVFLAIVLLLVAFIILFGSKIRLEEDINKVIPSSEKNDKLITALKHSKFADRLVICISLDKDIPEADPALLISYTSPFVDSLNNEATKPYIKRIEDRFAPSSYAGMYDLFYENLPLFLEEEDYDKIEEKIEYDAIQQAIKRDYEALITAGGFAMRDFILKDPLSLTLIALEKLESLRVDENFGLYDGYIISADQRNLLFFIIPTHPSTETSENARLLDHIEKYRHNLDNEFQGKLDVYYFGSMAASVGNASQIKADIILTLSTAILVLLIILGIYFRRKLSFLLLFLPALLGGGFAIAILSIIRGEVSAISLGLGSVMLGISIDYALHFMSHLKYTGTVKTVINDIAGPVMISSITTASAFLCLMVLRSEALHDLGLFAALSVLSSAVFTLTVLPQFFKDKHEHAKQKAEPQLVKIIGRIASYSYDRKGKLSWLIFLFLIVFIFTTGRVQFEANMDSMNYMSADLIEAEDHLDSISGYKLKSVFLVSSAHQLDAALKINESLQKDLFTLQENGFVKRYTSLHSFYPSSSAIDKKTKAWKAFWHDGKLSTVKESIITASGQYGFRENAFEKFYSLLHFNRAIKIGDLDPLREAFLDEYISVNDSLAMVTSILKVKNEDKAEVYATFEGHKDVIIFDRQSLTSSFMEGLHEDFNRLIIISLIVVFLILTLSFGRIELGIITFIPLLISWIWTLGIMGLLGIRFNIFNVVISTFIFGLGIDYAIFTMRGLIQEYQYGRPKLNSYKTSILLSGITTIVGIGVLIFAKHPALQSIAISAIIGILSVILITYTLLPRLFRFLIEHEGRSRKWPVTLMDFIFSLNTLAIFLMGVLILVVLRFLLQYLVPLSNRRKKIIFHRILSIACWTITYGSINFKKKISNRSDEDFKKPAIVVCNHQSHLDTVLTIMQNHMMVLLTNPWVQKSIFYRGFISYADFFSVGEGAEKLKEKIRKLVDSGYSVLYFPEGTRSENLEIGRFHQGAFYMARELELDILPIISYGSGNAMPKYEPFLTTSLLSTTIMPRIKPGDELIKETPLATARAIRKYFRAEYAQIRKKIETPSFYRKQVVRNYLYRGPILEWYMKVKIRMDGNYEIFDEYLPEKGLITDIGCGYGFMSYMLHLMSPQRRIMAYDHDRNKVDTALNCALKNDSIHFYHADITATEFKHSDAFLLIDVLHYIPEEEQKKLIFQCTKNLTEDGVIIIREADRSMQKKHRGTRISEILSTRIGFNKTWKGEKSLFYSSKEKYLKIFDESGLEAHIVDHTKMNSNLIYILKKKK